MPRVDYPQLQRICQELDLQQRMRTPTLCPTHWHEFLQVIQRLNESERIEP